MAEFYRVFTIGAVLSALLIVLSMSFTWLIHNVKILFAKDAWKLSLSFKLGVIFKIFLSMLCISACFAVGAMF